MFDMDSDRIGVGIESTQQMIGSSNAQIERAAARHPINRFGWIEVITGSMFSGKTEELLRRLRRAEIAQQKTLLVKPKMDKRFSETDVVSHSHSRLPSEALETSDQILEKAGAYEVIGIDEAQFFDFGLVRVCEDLASSGKRVILAGLDQDFQGEGFGPIPELMISAEFVTKQCAICVKCGRPATKNQRLSNGLETLEIGGSESYEARCRHCYKAPQ